MPLFGICTGVENAGVVKSAGWDFIEGNVQGVLMGDKDDGAWEASGWKEKLKGAELKMPAANCLVPGALKIVGPEADLGKLKGYMRNVLRRAEEVGMETLVLGSGGARNVPEGFEREAAREQILEFARMSAEVAAAHGVTIVLEHLNRKECNIVNSVEEELEYVRALRHPNFMGLVDTWHWWLEGEGLGIVEEALPWVRHVHLADKEGRVAPGQGGGSYREFFGVLKRGGYEGRISVEAEFVGGLGTAGEVLGFLKREWEG